MQLCHEDCFIVPPSDTRDPLRSVAHVNAAEPEKKG
jgi:hypothetical protein